MKRIILSLSLITLTTSLFAQEAADKKVQAGLIMGLGMNFVEMGTTKFATDGVGTDLTIGTNLNFTITESIGFCTGLEIDFETLKFRNAENQVYYNYSDKDILTNEDALASSEDQIYMLTSRKQKPIYVSLPTMMLFRTKFIGYFRYFGKFGLRTSILATNKTYDEGFEFPVGTVDPVTGSGTEISVLHENMSPKNEMLFIKSVAGFAGGVEWNFTGATSLVAELGFYFGITPLYYNKKVEKNFLYQTDGVTNEYFSNQAKHNQLRFKVSVLF